MIAVPAALDFESALAQRLRVAAGALLADPFLPARADPAEDSSELLERLVRSVHDDPAPERVWLLYIAVAAALPTIQEVEDGVRLVRLAPSRELTLWLFDRAIDTDVPDQLTRPMQLLTDRVVVDVDHSARHDLHTGIQQVVRRTVPIWARDHGVVAVAWTKSWRAIRQLTPGENRRVMHWGSDASLDTEFPETGSTLLVPWGTTVVLAETPARESCERLAALALYSGNSLVALGYDCIPVVSADLVPPVEPERFTRYLGVIKYATRVAAISETARVEFHGFSQALAGQGLPGPTVVECQLPASCVALAEESRPSWVEPGSRSPVPTVLSVGSFEPRKNHLALLYAAERLWREGLEFELLLIKSSGWGDELPGTIARLREAGRSITVRDQVTDAELVVAYRAARFTVFTSLHEGYGLPAAESLSLGTPVIATNYGSTREIGAAGGAVLIDPRDDEALVDAMRRLLTDDEQLAALRDEIEMRPVRTWQQYADELWDALRLSATDGVEAPE